MSRDTKEEMRKLKRQMEGKKYRHPRFGEVRVIRQPSYKAGGPRNVLIRLKNGTETVVPQRSLRKLRREVRKVKKYLILCLIPVFLSLAAVETKAFELSKLLKCLGEPEGVLIVYVDDRVIIDDPDEIKICFLPEAQNYQGFSVKELFDEALETMPLGPKMVLLAAVFNIRSSVWMFFYTEALGCRRRV